jgi:hypothetical protein
VVAKAAAVKAVVVRVKRVEELKVAATVEEKRWREKNVAATVDVAIARPWSDGTASELRSMTSSPPSRCHGHKSARSPAD